MGLKIKDSPMNITYVSAPDWCAACRTMHPVIERVSKKLNWPLDVIDSDEEPAQAALLQITSLPTTIAFENGREVLRFSGAFSEKKTLELLSNLNYNGGQHG
jgi:thioredoxin-like negative regulator of GroEL